MIEIDLPNLSATREFGCELGRKLFPGAIVALVGQPGAGKTELSRAIAEGLGVRDSRIVTSPTFVLVQEYESGRLPIYHFDSYRLRGDDDFAELGSVEYLEGHGVCLIEWADRVARSIPPEALWIELTATTPESRRARLWTTSARHAELLEVSSVFDRKLIDHS